jgi:hypothetical protein
MRKWEDSIKIDMRDVGRADVNWIELTQDEIQCDDRDELLGSCQEMPLLAFLFLCLLFLLIFASLRIKRP